MIALIPNNCHGKNICITIRNYYYYFSSTISVYAENENFCIAKFKLGPLGYVFIMKYNITI